MQQDRLAAGVALSRPLVTFAPGRPAGITTLMAVGDVPPATTGYGGPLKTGLITAGVAAVLGSRRAVLWGLIGFGVSLWRR